ncbi:hypothetical protein JRO89_XS04G0006900 [Xanthoceras sorbifolium]|uniref:Uncharacterized protein n=1 Tax=Xanthoceras sorbifolium TaxID=99658 RepID=A0ABQ8I473_9ROSI|nr:hypothetical protein JRO89_XS04G0006900 [Xanthoceras sorbifolium]
MAQVSICRAALALVLFAVALLSVTTAVMAQDSELAPSPSMDAGAAFPVTFSAPDPEMWIIQGTLAWRTSPVRTGGLKPNSSSGG